MQERQTDFWTLLWQKRFWIIGAGVLGAIAGIIASFTLPELYKSEAVVFPSQSSMVSHSEGRNVRESVTDFGDEDKAEALLQILQAASLKHAMVERFDLWNHWEIDTNDTEKNYKLNKLYEERVSFARTRHGSIEIEVLDKVPDTAAAMVNFAVNHLDTVTNAILKKRAKLEFEVISKSYNKLQRELWKNQDSLTSLVAMGVVSSGGRGLLYQALGNAKDQDTKNRILEQIDINNRYGQAFDAYSDMQTNLMEQIAEMKSTYDQAESNATYPFSYRFVVNWGEVPDKKAKPVRWLVTTMFTFSSVLLMIVGLLFYEKYKQVAKK